ncbi:MAG: signal peptide peptidase SppA, partial [Mariprofundaceae bacterium]
SLPAQTEVSDVIDAIRIAADDMRIKLLVLDLRHMQRARLAMLKEIRSAIADFRQRGKQVIATADSYLQSQFYLASSADEVYLHPMGWVVLPGFGAYGSYFKEALDKLKVELHVFRVGEYKSAVEPFTRNSMSSQSRENAKDWLGDLWRVYKNDVAQDRGITAGDIQDYADHPARHLAKQQGDAAATAMAAGLVDGLKTRDQVKARLIELAGLDKETHSYRSVYYKDYLHAMDSKRSHPRKSKNKVAVIVASGTILEGDQPAGFTGSDSTAALIRQAREDKQVKAVVLRIDSPGGSALASEIIRRELELTRQQGKPLVVSMGSMAASGGYWIAAAADEIWASEATLTGSIGIFGLMPHIHESLAALGIHNDGVGTTRLSGGLNPMRPVNREASQALQLAIEDGYRRFIRLVSEGRGMSPDAVEKVAQGRVWSGADAQRLGLVDKLGDLSAAAASAANLAGLGQNYELMRLRKEPKFMEMLIQNFAAWLPISWFPAELAAPLQHVLEPLRQLGRGMGVYALCLCEAP